jgi:hypothetical protein
VFFENLFYILALKQQTYHGKRKIPIGFGNGIINELGIRGHDCSLGDQRRIGCSILWLDLLNGFDIAGIGNDDGVFEELFVSRRHCGLLSYLFDLI